MLRKAINSLVNRLPRDPSRELPLIETCLRQLPRLTYWRLKQGGFTPGAIIDIGAHEGDWSRDIRSIFSAPILMVEAREEQRSKLEQVSREIGEARVIVSLLGSEQGKSVIFHANGSASSIFAERTGIRLDHYETRMQTLDSIVGPAELSPPLFLKLDIQGAELECLRGAPRTLAGAEVVQIETALLPYNEGAPDAREVITFMAEHGFSIWDISGFVRPDRVNLTHLDVIFVKTESDLRPKLNFG